MVNSCSEGLEGHSAYMWWEVDNYGILSKTKTEQSDRKKHRISATKI